MHNQKIPLKKFVEGGSIYDWVFLYKHSLERDFQTVKNNLIKSGK